MGKKVRGVVLAACYSLINQTLYKLALLREGHRGVCWPAGSEADKQKQELCLSVAVCVSVCLVCMFKHACMCVYGMYT